MSGSAQGLGTSVPGKPDEALGTSVPGKPDEALGTSVPGKPDQGLGTSVPSGATTEGQAEERESCEFFSRPPLSILILGDAARPEFHDARACLGRWGTVADFADPDSAAAAFAENRVVPDLLAVAQAFPGQFSHETIDRLRRLAPLARVLGLMGSWCEGEMRSGSPWPATLRTYWHHWPARGDRQLRRLAMGQSCSWALPLTASEEERLLADVSTAAATCLAESTRLGESRNAPPLQWGGFAEPEKAVADSIDAMEQPWQGLVAISTHSHEMADWLSAACRQRGLRALWQHDRAATRIDGATAAIFDSAQLCDEEWETVRRFAEAVRPAPLVALLSFPRIEDRDRAVSAGASAVLSKPVLLEDLLEALDQSISAANTS